MILSIVIPIYNSETYLSNSLLSILKQKTDLEYEVIAVNDGSYDDSLKILKRIKKEYPNLIVINQKNQGVNKARENGVKKAKGQYIMFVDSDDVLLDGTLEAINKIIINNKFDIIIFGLKETYRDNTINIIQYYDKSINKNNYIKLLLQRKVHWGPISRLFKRSNFENNIFQNISPHLKIGEDAVMNFKIAQHVKSVYLSNIIIYEYKRHQTSLMYAKDIFKEEAFMLFINSIINEFTIEQKKIFFNDILYFKVLMWLFYRKNGMKIKQEIDFTNQLYEEISQNSNMDIIKQNKFLLWWLSKNYRSTLYKHAMYFKNQVLKS